MYLRYFIDEKIYDTKKGKYIPISMKLHEEFTGFQFKHEQYWNIVKTMTPFRFQWEKGLPVYIVIFLQHSGKDWATEFFYEESEARKYISALKKAISKTEEVSDVDVHYGMGRQNLSKLLDEMPTNTYTSFRTPKNTYSITFGKVY